MNINWRNIILGVLAILAVSYVTFARADSVLAWSQVVTYVDGTPIPASLQSQVGYAIYSKPCGSTAAATRLNMPLLAFTTSYTWKPAPGCYTLTVTSNLQGAESAPTNAMNVTIPQVPAVPANPTTGFVTNDTTAYRMRQTVDGYAWVAFGTVPLGTACDATHSADGIYRPVPRAQVALTNRFDTFPLVSWAKCQ